jgi:flagellin-specific chaperone FliS
MQKIIRIQALNQQDQNRRKEVMDRSPSERIEMLMDWIDQTAKKTKIDRVVSIRHVSFR